jgi:hypothetical protein
MSFARTLFPAPDVRLFGRARAVTGGYWSSLPIAAHVAAAPWNALLRNGDQRRPPRHIRRARPPPNTVTAPRASPRRSSRLRAARQQEREVATDRQRRPVAPGRHAIVTDRPVPSGASWPSFNQAPQYQVFRPPMARPVVPRMVSTAPARIKMIPIVHRIEMPNTEPKNQQDDTQNDPGRSGLTATRGPAPRSNRSEYVTEPLNAKHDRAHRPSVRGACHHGGTAPW